MPASARYANVLCCWLCENSMGFVVQASHRCDHSSAGGAASSHGHHGQHLALLCLLRSLQGILPIPGAFSHVSVSYNVIEIVLVLAVNTYTDFHLLSPQFPDRCLSYQGAVCLGVWDQHLFSHHPEDHHYPDIC